ncbi:hypothetical protein AB0J72_08600 [Dactylosporangium sp. NPDC049742]|uniref:hypothetical protein n=1 Tax=Dactylosporangium sp. NPDC049742 TaxID=3154737 RepID=UPI0034374D40
MLDFVPAEGGRWHGLLFANHASPPRLTWCFEFPFEDDDDSGPLGLTVEWMPAPTDSWRRMGGLRLTTAAFGEPAEASVYHYVHHRFDTVDLRLSGQDGPSLRAVVSLSGDADRLGVDPVHADATLTFAGLLVALPGVTAPDDALARLAEFTDTTGLVLDPSGATAALRFVPRA